jgi:hypothetical protein
MVMVKKVVFLLLICWNFGLSNSYDLRIKASVLRGESLVTVNIDPADIENVFISEISKRKIKFPENTILDIFVFQFPASNPTITVTLRTEKGIHYVDRVNIELLGNRKKATIKLAKHIASRLPEQTDTIKLYDLTFDEIISRRKSIDLINISGNTAMKFYRKRYNNQFNWFDTKPLPFIVKDLDQYLDFCLNYQGLRKKIKRNGPIILKLKINENGWTTTEDIVSPFELNDKEKTRLIQAISALPIWMNHGKMITLELKIDLS